MPEEKYFEKWEKENKDIQPSPVEKDVKLEQEPKIEDSKAGERIKEQMAELQKSAPSTPVHTRDEFKEIKILPSTQQVGALLSLVFRDNKFDLALSIAKALDNPAVMDEFHDILIERYEELIEKGILKKK
ncbi:MAG: hypothetical protein KY054_00490 [Candidatus Nealsonbacteria bacterium]|nr:hypothetical protein [Candidatus Nealsonbacteria bacterium]